LNVLPSTGSGFGAYSNWTGGPVACDEGCYFADANGDGKADFIAQDMDGLYVLLSNGSGFEAPANWTNGTTVLCDLGCFLADVTGDGAADFIAQDDDGIWVVPAQ
jgi:hypothetical protein